MNAPANSLPGSDASLRAAQGKRLAKSRMRLRVCATDNPASYANWSECRACTSLNLYLPLYSVACSPQAWAAASVFYLLQACLGLSFDPARHEIRFRNPQLPAFLRTVEIKDLAIGGATIDLILERYPNNVGINIVRKTGDVRVLTAA